MNLILWRHAETKPSLLPDIERELSLEGLRNADLTAALLNRHLPEDTLILVSPAKRAQQTAAALNRPFQTLEALAPRHDAPSILQAIQWPELPRNLLIVAHQPALGSIIGRLTVGPGINMDVQNSHAYWISATQSRRAEPVGILQTIIGPDFIRPQAGANMPTENSFA